MPSDLWLADTNVLLRWVQPQDRDFPLVLRVIDSLLKSGAVICYTAQNLGEFWNVLTRPGRNNGYDFSIAQAEARTKYIESNLHLLPDTQDVYLTWRRLLVAHSVRGVQVHDARLVAAMQSHGVARILTFNTRDFARYAAIEAHHPAQVS